MSDDDLAIEYYRAVEDLFAGLRGVPHELSPKDTQLVRLWWRDRVPLAAVSAGLTEVFVARRDRGEEDPVASLSYCKHAVKKHARRLSEMHAGAESTSAGDDASEEDLHESLRTLIERLLEIAALRQPKNSGLDEAITRIADQLDTARELPPSVLEEHLFSLEAALLESCRMALPEAERRAIEDRARREAVLSGAKGEAQERTFCALRDRELRAYLGLPRLEL
jgi:hypothetical protein